MLLYNTAHEHTEIHLGLKLVNTVRVLHISML